MYHTFMIANIAEDLRIGPVSPTRIVREISRSLSQALYRPPSTKKKFEAAPLSQICTVASAISRAIDH